MKSTIGIADVLEKALLEAVKKDLLNHIVEKHMAAAEAELRERLKPLVEQLSLGRISEFKNMLRMEDQLNVQFVWTDPAIDLPEQTTR